MVVAIALSVSLLAAGPASPASLQAVLMDAASYSGVDRRSLQVLRSERVEWPDSALGCARAGELYSQVLTPGWLIEVRAGAKVLEYHTDDTDRLVLCAER